MDDIRKVALLADQAGNGCIEMNGKTIGGRTHHIALDLDFVLEVEQGKGQQDGLAGDDGATCANEHAIGADALDNITKHTFFDGIFRDDVGSASRIATPIRFRTHGVSTRLDLQSTITRHADTAQRAVPPKRQTLLPGQDLSLKTCIRLHYITVCFVIAETGGWFNKEISILRQDFGNDIRSVPRGVYDSRF